MGQNLVKYVRRQMKYENHQEIKRKICGNLLLWGFFSDLKLKKFWNHENRI